MAPSWEGDKGRQSFQVFLVRDTLAKSNVTVRGWCSGNEKSRVTFIILIYPARLGDKKNVSLRVSSL